MRYILTGCEGYIGSYLKDILIGEILLVDKQIGIDINTGLYKQFQNFHPDIIYHLAAQTSVNKSFQDPEQDIIDNLFATLEMLKFQCKIIFISSGTVYGDKLDAKETDLPQPQSPYAITKLAAEYYIINSGVPYIILRMGNVWGKNNNKGVIKSFNEGGKIYGDGKHTRDYVYIDDVIEALLQCQKWENGIYNIGTRKPTSVNEIADLMGIEKVYDKAIPEQNFISLNIDKAINMGWRPKTALCQKNIHL